jgi:oligopeptide transport system substrate-binding protein
MLKLLLPVLAVLAAVLLTMAADTPTPKADLRIINRGDLGTMDLHQMSWLQDLRVARLVWEGLVRPDVNSPGYDVKPCLAESWTVSPDRLTYTFHLRKEAAWSNGRPVLPSHLAYSWRRAMLPETGADYAKFFGLIKGGSAFIRWRSDQLADFAKAASSATTSPADRGPRARELWEDTKRRFDDTVGIRADDDAMTLTVVLERPVPYFLDVLCFPVFSPLYPPLLEEHQSIDPQTARLRWDTSWTKPPKAVFNGPMTMTSWRFKRDMRLERNPFYWNPGALAVDSITVPCIEEPNAQVLAFETGAVDWVSDVAVAYRSEMLARKRDYYQEHQAEYDALHAQGLGPIEIDRRLPPDPQKRNTIHSFPAFGTYFYNFNCMPKLHDGRDNPFRDPRVRRAFAMTVDKSTLVSQVRRSDEPVARTLIPPGSIGGYTSPHGLDFDPAAAKELLAQAGYPDGRGFPTVEILFNSEGGHDLIAQSIARNWQDLLGINVILDVNESKVFREKLKGQDYMISRATWFGDYGDPTTFLDINRAGDGNNDRKFSSAAYESLLDKAQDEPDPAARMSLLSEAERLLVEDEVPLIPIFHYATFYLFDPHKLAGVSSHPRGVQLLYEFDILGDGKGPDAHEATPPPTGAKRSPRRRTNRKGTHRRVAENAEPRQSRPTLFHMISLLCVLCVSAVSSSSDLLRALRDSAATSSSSPLRALRVSVVKAFGHSPDAREAAPPTLFHMISLLRALCASAVSSSSSPLRALRVSVVNAFGRSKAGGSPAC